jgi:integrase
MASITRRSDASFQIRISNGYDENGKRLYYTETYYPSAKRKTAQEKEAQKYADDLEQKLRSGKDYETSQMTFKEFAETCWKPRKLITIEKTTLEGYEGTLERIVYPAIGNMRLFQINILPIQHIYDQMVSDHKSPASVRQVHAVISDILKHAYKMNVIDENPCHRAVLPKMKDSGDIRFFTDEETQAFLKSLREGYDIHYPRKYRKNGRIIPAHDRHIDVDTQWIVYFNLAIYAGCRRGELLALTWKDIDFKTRTITIEKARARTKAGDITKKPKNKHSIRTIIVPADCIHLLILWRKEQMQLAWNMGETWKGYYGRDFDKNFIFIQPETGLPMNVSTPTHKFKEILKLYNDTHELEDQLPDISLHELRHTSATLLLANGTDIETVSHRLGHSKASTTLDVYGHAMKKMDSKASDTLESILSGRKKA